MGIGEGVVAASDEGHAPLLIRPTVVGKLIKLYAFRR